MMVHKGQGQPGGRQGGPEVEMGEEGDVYMTQNDVHPTEGWKSHGGEH